VVRGSLATEAVRDITCPDNLSTWKRERYERD